MTEIPRKQREYFDRIKKALGQQDPEMLTDQLRNKSPLAIREDLVSILGEHVNENYDKPLNIFEKQKLLEEIPVNYTDQLPKGVGGKYIKERGLYVPKENLSDLNKQTGIKLHEYGHANDELKGFDGSQEYAKTKATGLDAAENAFGGHHKGGFFEKEALMDLLRNKKLKMIAPLAIGASVYGAGEKAMAGDIPGAALDAGSIVDPTGLVYGASEVRERLQHPEKQEEYAKSDYLRALPPGLDLEESAIQQNEDTPDKFNKIKQRLLNK